MKYIHSSSTWVAQNTQSHERNPGKDKGKVKCFTSACCSANELQAEHNNELHNESGRSIAGKHKQYILSVTK